MTVNPAPASAGAITGTASVCQGQAGIVYSVGAISNATGYAWALTAGASITAGANTNSITVSFSGSASSGNISVHGTNSCGNGAESSPFSVTVNPAPAPAGTVSSTASVCQGQAGVVYSVGAISNATGYSWTLPTGASITAGANTNSITVSFSTSASSGNISVHGTNSCGNGAESSPFSVTVSPAPASAGTVTGTASVCQGQSGVVYSVSAISNATGYSWTLPTGASITSGANTNSITVSFSSSASSGNISVHGTNSCGNGAESSPFSVTVSPAPASAGTVTGTASVCQGQSGVVYSVSAISNATGYSWTLPTGASITSGANTNSITVSFSSSASSGNISVHGTNSCGNGGESTGISVTVIPSSAGGTIAGGSTVCEGSASGLLELTGQVGSIVKWQNSTDGTTWNDIPNTATTYTSGPLTVNTYFRAVVQNGTCDAAYSASALVSVSSPDPSTAPEVIFLYDLSASMSRDFYDHYTSEPEAVKLFQANAGLTAFIDLLNTNNPCQTYLGIARFPNSPQNGCDAGVLVSSQVLNTGFRDNLINVLIPGLIANGGSTPLLAGVETAINMFTTSGYKTIVLITDGRQNCPYTGLAASISNLNTSLRNSNIRLFTIGFGDYGIVPEDILNQLVAGTGGYHYNITSSLSKLDQPYDPSDPGSWNPATALQSIFANISKVILGLGVSDDPLDILNQGEIKQFDIPVTAFDKSVCFFVSWAIPHENNPVVSLIMPSGAELPLNQPGIDLIRRSNHTIITLRDGILNRPGMTGAWKLKIDGTQLTSPEYFQHTVLNSSRQIDFRTWFDKAKYLTGDKMRISLQLSIDGQVLKGLKNIRISGSKPSISAGNWMAIKKPDSAIIEKIRQRKTSEYVNLIRSSESPGIVNRKTTEQYLSSQKEFFLKNIDPVELRIEALKEEYSIKTPRMEIIEGLRFFDDGRNGDEKANDGIFTSSLTALKEGTYSFNITVSDTRKEGKIIRENHLQTYVTTRIQNKVDIKQIKLIEKALNGQYIYDVKYEIRDKFGNIPLPDAIKDIKPEVNNGSVIGGIKDNMDGTYSSRVSIQAGSKNPKSIKISLPADDTAKSNRIKKQLPGPVPVTAVVILVIIVFLVIRKKE